MPLLQLITLALVQGITEFLPISSSAHLVLTPVLFGWRDQGLLFDIAVHAGTLVAVCLFFWREVLKLPVGMVHCLGKKRGSAEAKLFIHIVIGTIPLVIAGFFLHALLPDGIRSIEVIAWATIGFGVLLWVADWIGAKRKALGSMDRFDALLIGLAQIAALIPGASRAGVTMTAARFLGYTRVEAARFSLLLGIPAIAAATILAARDVYQAGSWAVTQDLIIAALLSCLSALAAIALMLRWLQKASFTPFVLYRLALGGVLLYVVYF